ncbi:MAG: STAS/SEC14 domain-containing protein [Campylobacteraceae bacterium]|nr:STAS/SEC14 domain-containing protein [Campylobacteraceae bacterium]
MSTSKNGLSIGLQRTNTKVYLYLKAVGTLTHEDYEKLTPMLENTLKQIEDPKIKALIDCSELNGWEIQAAWDDLKIGLKHGSEFDKVAIITNRTWIEVGAKVSTWFINGQIQTFEKEDDAINWLSK